MADVVRSVTVVLAAASAVLLGHRALRHWWAERAGRAYELPVDRTGTALRAGAAGAAALLAAALAVPLVLGGAGGQDGTGTGTAAPAPVVVPSPPARTPEPAPPPPEVRTLGHPAGGTLDQLQDGTRVWLPPQYTSPKAAGIGFPVVVAHVPATADPDLYGGFALATKRGLSDSFVLVLPTGCAHDSAHDSARDAAAVAEAERRYRVLTTRTATGVIGVGADAPCAVREALATTGRYAAAAGISGLYPPLAPSPLPHPSLLLATTSGETAAGAAALRLRDALHPHGDEVRVIDGVAAHRELFALIAGYLTEKLDGPARTVTPPSQSPSPSPSLAPSPAASPIPSLPPHAGSTGLPPVSPPSLAPRSPLPPLISRAPSTAPSTAYPPHTAPQSRKPPQSS
ncbi:hypothetical protein NMG29_06145 [Streptomyces cocklensis]|uniref:Uncharacterized protein n=1 Tax=Actinacidiphila cocklensis TaxID=887465 RepID=A0A9W4E047_9ACTN|nr:hypothetical protein [Actinacidiphila cocklensis]MDD1057810.1 hypothetical protein [Actinacidiphila cocklensis]CAG6398537.1 conserved hypothetical protein [Actinacidiphila cocklensis]